MSGTDEPPGSVTTRLVELFEGEGETRDVPMFVTAALGLVAAVLVGASTLTAFETGHAGVGLSFLAAVTLFLGTVSVFEAARRLGASD